MKKRLAALPLFLIPSLACSSVLVIGHRGACGHRPEHTRASYELAIDMGADFIEPDLVMTKDRVLIVRHENEISQTTDVADKFPARRTTKFVDGEKITGWFAEDFTLAEIKTLRAKERLPTRDHSFDGQFEIMTFREVIELAQRRGRELGRTIGIYPETKHPTYFASMGMDLAEPLLDDLRAFGWDRIGSPVIVQSFELSILQRLHRQSPLFLVFLVDEPGKRPYDNVISGDPRTYGDLMRPNELRKMATVVWGIGPWKRLILPEAANGTLLAPTSLIQDAHAAGLKVHAYTFRSDQEFLNPAYGKNPALEYQQFCRLGVDGVFTDFADDAVAALHSCSK